MRGRVATLAVVLFLFTALLSAQTGRIAGTVRDASGALLPGVTVEVESPSLQGIRTAVTDADGRYVFTAIPSGTYKVTFKLAGFKAFSRTNVIVTPDFTAMVSADLQVGDIKEQITVTAEAPMVDVANARQQTNFTGDELRDLPTTRNLSSLMTLVPGLAGGTPGCQGAQAAGCGPTVSNFNSHAASSDADGLNQGRVQVDGLSIGVNGLGGRSYSADIANAQTVTFAMSGSLGESTTSLPPADRSRESYAPVQENVYRPVSDEPLSTFSIDVDTASYANIRRFLNSSALPPRDAVRVEEMINYFHFEYPQPKDDQPFSVTTELTDSPWHPGYKLALVGLQGRDTFDSDRTPRNLVFLIDVSGSMQPADKLPLIKNGMRMLVDTLQPRDRVAIVVYAGSTGVVLPTTAGDRKDVIHRAIESLGARGSTNGGAGIKLAYELARQQFVKGGVNRVILATDGDFNVGITSRQALMDLIETERRSGVFLSVLGVGTDNLQDATMEMLADKGNGNYSYLDSIQEAQRVLVREAASTLVTIAKDVKIQIEFNPQTVAAYRLIGYENRLLKAEDFNDDRKDAGEIGAGHSVTALYEIVPVGVALPAPGVDPLKYQQPAPRPTAARPAAPAPQYADELMTVKLRYKAPDGDTSRLIATVVRTRTQAMSVNMGFASAVAELGMLLRGSEHAGSANYDALVARARKYRGADGDGYRAEFIRLSELAKGLRTLQTASR